MSRKAQHPCPGNEWWVGTKCAEKPAKKAAKHTVERSKARFLGTEKQWEAFAEKYGEGPFGGSKSSSPKPAKKSAKGAKKVASPSTKKTTAKKTTAKKTTAKKTTKSAKGRKAVAKVPEAVESSEEVEKPVKAKPTKAKGKAKATKAKASSKETVASASAAALEASMKMKVADLKQLAKDHGISLTGLTKKDQFVKHINSELLKKLKKVAEKSGADEEAVEDLVVAIDEAQEEQKEIVEKVVKAIKKAARSTGKQAEIDACAEFEIGEDDCKASSVRERYLNDFGVKAKAKGNSLKAVLDAYRAKMLAECAEAGIEEADCNYESLRRTAGDDRKLGFRDLVSKRREYNARRAEGREGSAKAASSSSASTSSEEAPAPPREEESSSSPSEVAEVAVAKPKAKPLPSKPKNWWDEDNAFDKECDTEETYYHATRKGYECTSRGTAPGEGEVAYRTKEGKVIIANRTIISALKNVFPGGQVIEADEDRFNEAYRRRVKAQPSPPPKVPTPKVPTPKEASRPATPKEHKPQSPPKTVPEDREAMRQRIIAELKKCIEGGKK